MAIYYFYWLHIPSSTTKRTKISTVNTEVLPFLYEQLKCFFVSKKGQVKEEKAICSSSHFAKANGTWIEVFQFLKKSNKRFIPPDGGQCDLQKILLILELFEKRDGADSSANGMDSSTFGVTGFFSGEYST